MKELKQRITDRGTESKDQIEERMERVKSELGYQDLFDHTIVNDSVENATAKIIKILNEEI